MIYCPSCKKGELFYIKKCAMMMCPLCEHVVRIEDNIMIFHPDKSETHSGMDPELYRVLIKEGRQHFWVEMRKHYLSRILKECVNLDEKIIEIGAGIGNIASHFLLLGYQNISVGEVHLSGLLSAKMVGINKLYQFDIMDSPFFEHFDVVCMFDVLEHIDDDELAVKSLNKMLVPNGKAIVTVPAHMWLWSEHDLESSHRRRYEIDQLRSLFTSNGFKVLKINAFFTSIVPFLFVRSLFYKRNSRKKNNSHSAMFKINPLVNRIFRKLLQIEMLLFSGFYRSVGGSLIMIAEKR